VPDLRIPDVILEGHTDGYHVDAKTIEDQFMRYEYPAPGYPQIKL
jgi:hypothetical protein